MKTEKPQKAHPTPLGGIKIATHGRFYYKSETAKGTKPFVLVVRARSLEMFRESSQKYIGTDDNGRAQFRTNSYLNIRGQLKKRLLPILLSKTYPDFARVRFVTIDEITAEDGSTLDLPVNLRSRTQLVEMVRDEKMPIDPAEYLEIDDLRTDILEYIQHPEIFLENKPIKDRRRQEERDFITMNDMGDETLPPIREAKAAAAAAAAAAAVAAVTQTPAVNGVLDD
jgi:hypothetical protein